ncbi:MAG: ribosomal protein S18-alanine N-acetyltransferase [Gemmatimonadales bacterium]
MADLWQLRSARPADAGALAVLERAAFGDPWSVAQLRNALAGPSAVALVAEQESTIVGYVLGRVVVDQAEVLSIATMPDRRRLGIGRRLLDAMLGELARHGAHSVWLEVRESNLAARKLYQDSGFVADGIRRDYYRQPVEDALVLRRPLGPASRDRVGDLR